MLKTSQSLFTLNTELLVLLNRINHIRNYPMHILYWIFIFPQIRGPPVFHVFQIKKEKYGGQINERL